MNDNEPKKGAVKKFIIKHQIDFAIGACIVTGTALLCGASYISGRIDQYNADARGFGKQLIRAVDILDDDAKAAFIDTFDGTPSTYSI